MSSVNVTASMKGFIVISDGKCNKVKPKKSKHQKVDQLQVIEEKVLDNVDKKRQQCRKNKKIRELSEELKEKILETNLIHQENDKNKKLLELATNTQDMKRKHLEDKLKEVNKINEHIQRENFGQSQQIDMLSMKVGEVLSDNNMLRHENAKLLKQFLETSNQFNDVKKQKSKLQQKVEEQSKLLKFRSHSKVDEMKEYESKVEKLTNEKESLEREIKNQAQEFERILNQIKEALNGKGKFNKEISDICKSTMRPEDKGSKKFESEDEVISSANNLRIIKITQQNDKLSQQLSESLQCNKNLKTYFEEQSQMLKFARENSKDNINKLEDLLQALHTENEKLKHESKIQQRQIKALSKQFSQASLDQLNQDADKDQPRFTEFKIAVHLEKSKKLKEKIEELKAEKEKLQQENIEKSQKIERISRHLSRYMCVEKKQPGNL